MTLILALTCNDAVVMAADSQATELQGGNLMAGTSWRASVEKLHQLGPNMVWGASGSIGVMQNIEDALGDGAARNSAKPDDPGKRIRPEIVKAVAPVLKDADAGYIQVPGRPPNPPLTSMPFAGRTAGPLDSGDRGQRRHRVQGRLPTPLRLVLASSRQGGRAPIPRNLRRQPLSRAGRYGYDLWRLLG